MCHFITAAITSSASIDALNDIAKKYDLKFYKIKNSFVESQLPKGFFYLSKYTNHCDCGTVLGSMYHFSNIDFDFKKEIKKLKRKGWSQTKIQRWLGDKEKNKEKLKRQSSANKQRHAPEANEWFEFIKSVVHNHDLKKFGLLLHMYRTSPETEKVKLKSIENVSIKNIEYDYLTKIRENIFYQFEN